MIVSARTLNWLLLAGIAGVALMLPARSANAQACTNDIDCTANSACGGEVCDWVVSPLMTCKAAGGQSLGHDGWCMADTDCKCHALGATCNLSNFACTFTRPCEADGGTCTGGGTDAGGGGGGGGGGGCNVAGGTAGIGWASLLGVAGLIAARRRRWR
jgi:hypothetical protein